MVEEGSALLDSHRVTASPPRSASRQTDSESPLLFSRVLRTSSIYVEVQAFYYRFCGCILCSCNGNPRLDHLRSSRLGSNVRRHCGLVASALGSGCCGVCSHVVDGPVLRDVARITLGWFGFSLPLGPTQPPRTSAARTEVGTYVEQLHGITRPRQIAGRSARAESRRRYFSEQRK